MRSAAIAEEAISRGIECIFAGAVQHVGWVSQRIGTLGFSQILEPNEFESDFTNDILILDSYTLEVNDDFIQPARWKKIIVLSDEITPNYRGDLFIHPGLDGAWYRGNKENFLYGPRFIPLRKSIRDQSHQQREFINKIVIFGGGTDPFNFALSAAKVLMGIDGFVVASFFSKDETGIGRLDSRFIVNDFGSLLDKEIESADLVFTTASTSSLEVIARGIPLGVACAVSNQSNYHDAIVRNGLASSIGERVKTNSWKLDEKEMRKMIEDLSYRRNLVSGSKGLVDFDGASRIIDSILRLTS